VIQEEIEEEYNDPILIISELLKHTTNLKKLSISQIYFPKKKMACENQKVTSQLNVIT